MALHTVRPTTTFLVSELSPTMQLSLFTFLALGFALVETSSAAPAPASALSKRVVDNLPPSDQFITCPGYRYSRAQVEKAIQQGINTTPTTAPQPGMYPFYRVI